MAFPVNEKIVRFEITVDNAAAMQVFHAQDDLGQILFRPIFRQGTKYLDQRSLVAAVQILHDQIVVVLARERPIQFSHKVALALPHHNGSLSLNVGDLILRNHVRLLQDFDGVILSSRFLLGEVDATESTLADRFNNFKIFD